MQELKAKLVGIAPLMMHNERLANHSDQYTREIKKLTGQRKKTDETHEQIKRLEWRGSLYDRDGRVVVPSDNILASVQNACKTLKRGKDFNAAVIAPVAFFPLIYPGPTVIDELYGDGATIYVDYRSVVIQGRRTMRCRPIFPEWALDITLNYDEEIFNEDDLRQCVEIAGERIGTCERRPRCGRFLVEWPTAKKKVA